MGKHEHLDLPVVKESYVRKTRKGGGGYALTKRNYKQFINVQIETLNKISRKYQEEKQIFKDYPQELVLKVKTAQAVNDERFRDELRRAGCDTLVSTSGKNAEWIISTTDSNFTPLKNKLNKRTEKTKPDFIDGIDSFEDFSYDKKKGPLLKENPLGRVEVAPLVISLIRKETDLKSQKLNSAIELIISLCNENGFKVHDKLVTDNVCLILLESNEVILKTISRIDIVYRVDRPAQFEFESDLLKNLDDVGENTPPPDDAHGILVMDSGIILHPLLSDAVDANNGIVGLPDKNTEDDKVHGTKVAGIALHGDIRNCIKTKFSSEVWIYSAKVYYQNGRSVIHGSEKLLETNIKNSIDEILQKFPKCRVINISFGYPYNRLTINSKQFDLAALIDDLSIKYKDQKIIFVISNGNIKEDFYRHNTYPNYLLGTSFEVKMMDPATSVHAISVGALQDFDSKIDQPSNITTIGPGINGMIKPDLVETGGGFNGEITVLNPNFQQRLFTYGMGTSFSAPKISHYFGKLFNRFPQYGRNLIKCFLISSANYPSSVPDEFPKLNSKIKIPDLQSFMNVYGFGKPNIEKALASDDDRVVFKFEGKMNLNQVRYFTIKLPDQFVTEKGTRKISVTLVYDPPIKQTRADYFGTRMEFHLFRNRSVEDIMEQYNKLNLNEDDPPETSDTEQEDEGKIPKDLLKDEIKLKPSSSLRKKSPHQKGAATMATSYTLSNEHPLVLVVLTQKRWEFDERFEQDFAVVVTLEHEKSIDLYNKIKLSNPIKVQSRVRV